MASGVTRQRGIVLVFAALVTIGAGGLLIETNQQSEGLVLTAVLGLLLLNEVSRAFRRSALTMHGAAVLLAFGLLAVAIPPSP